MSKFWVQLKLLTGSELVTRYEHSSSHPGRLDDFTYPRRLRLRLVGYKLGPLDSFHITFRKCLIALYSLSIGGYYLVLVNTCMIGLKHRTLMAEWATSVYFFLLTFFRLIHDLLSPECNSLRGPMSTDPEAQEIIRAERLTK